MQSVDELNEAFGVPGVLVFDEPHEGMPRARMTTAVCTAELYVQGAHLTAWQPGDEEPVLFLSEGSAFAPGKAIRGGIPVIFPWFGAPESSPVHPAAGLPSHGFARTSPWTVQFAALAGEDLHLSLTLDPTEAIEELGFGGLQLGAEFRVGKTLAVRLTVANAGERALMYEEALHAYLRIADAHAVTVEGLMGVEFLDKTEGFQRKRQTEPGLRFVGETDRPYLNTATPVTVVDPVLGRRLVVTKEGSETTVVWNPGAELAAKLADMEEDGWKRFACVETANAAENAVTLGPKQARTTEMRLRVERL